MTYMVIGGSPCTHWSIAQKNGRKTTAEGIGWELFLNYKIAVEKVKALAEKEGANFYFLYENNKSAAEPIKEQIRQELGVTVPSLLQADNGVRFTYINSALVSAQNRQRFYVTNFGDIEQPADRGILLRDILETNVNEKYFYKYPLLNIDMSKEVCAIMDYKSIEMGKRILNPNFKLSTLMCCGGGNTQKKVMDNGRARKLTPIEYERGMTMPDGYTKCVTESHRYNGLGNGWNAETIIHLLKHAKIPLNEEITVISMYDGIGTGRYCLDKMGYKNVKYYAYELDKYAMQIANSNYPDIKQMGDAFAVRNDSWKVGDG